MLSFFTQVQTLGNQQLDLLYFCKIMTYLLKKNESMASLRTSVIFSFFTLSDVHVDAIFEIISH